MIKGSYVNIPLTGLGTKCDSYIAKEQSFPRFDGGLKLTAVVEPSEHDFYIYCIFVQKTVSAMMTKRVKNDESALFILMELGCHSNWAYLEPGKSLFTVLIKMKDKRTHESLLTDTMSL